MFNKKNNPEDPTLQMVIDDTIAQMHPLKKDSAEFETLLTNLEKLSKLQNTKTSASKVSPDTLAIVGANLAGILLTLNYERLNVVTSKAWSLVVKPK